MAKFFFFIFWQLMGKDTRDEKISAYNTLLNIVGSFFISLHSFFRFVIPWRWLVVNCWNCCALWWSGKHKWPWMSRFKVLICPRWPSEWQEAKDKLTKSHLPWQKTLLGFVYIKEARSWWKKLWSSSQMQYGSCCSKTVLLSNTTPWTMNTSVPSKRLRQHYPFLEKGTKISYFTK